MQVNNKYKSYLILLGALCFSTSGTIQAYAPEGATPYVVGALRMVVGGLILFLWCLYKKNLKIEGTWKFSNVALSVIALTGYQLFFFSGVLHAGVAVGTVVAIGFSPIVVAILSIVFLKEIPQKIWYVATAISILGLVLINLQSVELTNISSIILPLAAGGFYALYFIFSKPLVKEHSPELVMMVLFLISGICLLPVFFIFPISWIFTLDGVIFSLVLGFITSALAFSLLLEGLKYTSSANAATLSLGEPLGAACFGIFLLGEPVTFTSIFGISCILGSVLILTYFGSEKNK